MPVPVIMPKNEMSQEKGRLVDWLKQEGDMVQRGEPLLSIETDKLTMEVESPADGILAGICAHPGQDVPVSTIIAYLLQEGEKLPSAPRQDRSVEEASRASRITPLARRVAEKSGLELAHLQGSGPAGQIRRTDVEAALRSRSSGSAIDKRRASPSARRLAREMGVDLEAVSGSGPRGRIQGEDVLQAGLQQDLRQPLPSAQFVNGQEYISVPLEGIRRTIAERMHASWQAAPMITLTTRSDMTSFERLRSELNGISLNTGGPHVSVTALLVKIAAAALADHPYLNSSIAGDEIRLFPAVHMGVAAALPGGLIVPVIRSAGDKSIQEIAVELTSLAEKARSGKLLPQDVSGGTFTLSNLGPYGIEQFSAILNPGQAGILAAGAIQRKPWVVSDHLEVRPVMHMTLSADHRIVDGAQAATFMRQLKQIIETPSLLLW
jgi:pyruvate dehydrogenase E2 component (dihydrolipoamide acetyltransferase)